MQELHNFLGIFGPIFALSGVTVFSTGTQAVIARVFGHWTWQPPTDTGDRD